MTVVQLVRPNGRATVSTPLTFLNISITVIDLLKVYDNCVDRALLLAMTKCFLLQVQYFDNEQMHSVKDNDLQSVHYGTSGALRVQRSD